MQKLGKKTLRVLALGACALLVAGSLAGCGGSKTPADQAGSAEPQAAASVVFGIKSGSAKSVEVTNKTTHEITTIDLKGSSEATWTQHLTASGSWKDSEKAQIYYTAPAVDPAASKPATGQDVAVALRPQFDIQLTFSDAGTCVLHGVQLEGLTDACFEYDAASKLAYLQYCDSGQIYTTLDAEKAYAAQQSAPSKVGAGASNNAAADKAAAEKKALAARKAAEARKTANKKKSQKSSGVKQKNDQCVNDLLLK